MVLYRSFVDDDPQYPTEPFPGGPDATYPAVPTPGTGGLPPAIPGVKDPPLPPPGGGGGHGGQGGLLSGRPHFRFAPVPRFNAPQFVRPTLADAQNEPGYQFRLQGGADALEASAAAGGVLRTGGTLRDLVEYGQNFATQEYGNVFNRALAAYDRDYRGAADEFAPRMTEWSTLSQAEIQAALAQYEREYRMWAINHGGGGGGANIPPPPQLPNF